MRAVVWTAEPTSALLCEQLKQADLSRCTSLTEFLKAARDPSGVAFIDESTLAILAKQNHTPAIATVVICSGPLATAVAWLPTYPWLAHVISAHMLQHPMIGEHLRNVLSTMYEPKPRLLDWVGADVAGRRVLLTQASRRAERLERMADFFNQQGVGTRTSQLLRDVAEELLTNAFYDAPVAAGAVKHAISRTQDVSLPEDDACDLVYGCRDDLVFVRVKDPFGALSRQRLVEVLMRCARSDMRVEVDETMGGAGLGLWRIFAVASFVAISVVNYRTTEFLVGIAKRSAPAARPFAFHMFFKPGSKRRFWHLFDGDTNDLSVNKSVMIVKK